MLLCWLLFHSSFGRQSSVFNSICILKTALIFWLCSISVCRGLDWVPPPVPPAYKPPPQEEQLQQQYTPKGSWQDIGGVTCYVTSSGSSDGSSGSNDDSSGSSGGVQPAASDTMTVLMLPDHFALADSKALLQVGISWQLVARE